MTIESVSSCTPACRRKMQRGRAALREAQQVQTAGRPAAVPLDALQRRLQLLQGGRQAAGAALCRFAVWAPLHRRQVILWHAAPVYINVAEKTRPGLDCIAHSWNEHGAPRSFISERLHAAHAARISRSSRAATGDRQDRRFHGFLTGSRSPRASKASNHMRPDGSPGIGSGPGSDSDAVCGSASCLASFAKGAACCTICET